jgi:toxin CcdB
VADRVIRRIDVVGNPARSRSPAPCVVILQSHFLPDFPPLVVAPIRLRENAEGIEGLQVPIDSNGADYTVMISELGHIPRRLPGTPAGNLTPYHDDIARALDRLFTGF